MAVHLNRERVEEWIDEDIVEYVEEISDEGSLFNYLVQMSGLNFHIGQTTPDGPLSIASTVQFDPQTLELLIERDTERKDLLTQFENALTAAPGWYTFIGGDGNPGCNFQQMQSIRLEYRIYPDGASQHALMNGLIDMANAVVFLRDTVETLTVGLETS